MLLSVAQVMLTGAINPASRRTAHVVSKHTSCRSRCDATVAWWEKHRMQIAVHTCLSWLKKVQHGQGPPAQMGLHCCTVPSNKLMTRARLAGNTVPAGTWLRSNIW
jgi:hypothetical protein